MKVLLLNQCFWPDVVATAQQLTGVARSLRDAGHEVTVIAARHGYDDPRRTFSAHERWHGIDIHRVSSVPLGKKSRWRRALNFGSFLVTCAGRLLFTPRHDVVVALTSPPLISWLASMFTRVKGGHLIFWVMDLNPDEAIAAGWLRQDSFAGLLLAHLLKSSLRRAARIVVLDRFMKERVVAKGIAEETIAVVPPAFDASIHFDREGRQAFRRRYSLQNKFVVMYAGNHSPCNPLDTLLAAAKLLKDRDDILFLFVGGGSELDKVKESAATLGNIRWLPYQPQAELSALLSAADLHAVVMGDAFTGIIHPSKIYNLLAIGSPFIFIGPGASHVVDIIAAGRSDVLGTHANHGQSQKVAQLIAERADYARVGTERPSRSQSLSQFNLKPGILAVIEAAGAQTPPALNIEPDARASASQV